MKELSKFELAAVKRTAQNVSMQGERKQNLKARLLTFKQNLTW